MNIIARAWHEKAKRMFSPEEMGHDELSLIPDGRGFANVSSTSPRLTQWYPYMKPLLYSGLNDKSGKRVFEGDIIKAEGYPLLLVVFENATFVCVQETKTQISVRWNLGTFVTEHVEVIGNIYENPEMWSKNKEKADA